ncbi:unnamed protein product [Adineta ricciae]|uniref:Prolyl 4-hydroxylase alpha subunit domain-containing protein n=1 Tax=Adineta ricciae TaxID=249248 RepID=A0A815EGA1_ADIRI|nr:unnamed protein product [Adineta ricciae]
MQINKRDTVLLFCLSLLSLVRAVHFRGGVITHKILGSSGSTISILLSQTYTVTHISTPCNDSWINNLSKVIVFSIKMQCSQKCDRNQSFENLLLGGICIDYSVVLNTTVLQLSNRFDLVNAFCCIVMYQDGNWRELSLPVGIGIAGSWSFLSVVDLRLRSNGKFNSPPASTMISPVEIFVGVAQLIPIPVIDPDNDHIQCRFAQGVQECGSVCYPNSLPAGTILYSNCTLFINGSNVNDWYAAAIVIEDFVSSISTSPLSTIPLQFLIHVIEKPSCSHQPVLTSPNNHYEQCNEVAVNQTIYIELVAENLCSNSTVIKDIGILSFPSLTKSSLIQKNSSSTWSVFLTWIPTVTQIGSQLLCAIAVDSERVRSNQYCISFIVVGADTITCASQRLPTTTADYTSVVRYIDETSTERNLVSLQDSTTHRDEVTNVTMNTLATSTSSSSVCRSTWLWLGPLLASLLTLLCAFLFCCCCYPFCCPNWPGKHRNTRTIATNTSDQSDLILPPPESYTVYDIVQYHPSHQTAKIVSPESVMQTQSEMFMFGRRTIQKPHILHKIDLGLEILDDYIIDAQSYIRDEEMPSKQECNIPEITSNFNLSEYKYRCPRHRYSIRLIERSPLIIYIEQFLTQNEIQHIIDLAEPLFQPSMILTNDGNADRSKVRTSTTAPLERQHTPIVKCIEQRFAQFQGDLDVECIEPLQVVKYDADQHYGPHYDWISDPERLRISGQRVTTFFTYLHAHCSMGETEFISIPFNRSLHERFCDILVCDDNSTNYGLRFRPLVGNSVFWYNMDEFGQVDYATYHTGHSPGKNGQKIGLNTWTRLNKFFPIKTKT